MITNLSLDFCAIRLESIFTPSAKIKTRKTNKSMLLKDLSIPRESINQFNVSLGNSMLTILSCADSIIGTRRGIPTKVRILESNCMIIIVLYRGVEETIFRKNFIGIYLS